MSTKVQKKSNKLKKVLKNILEMFIRIETIPFCYDGKMRKHCTMYVFGIEVCSNSYSSKIS